MRIKELTDGLDCRTIGPDADIKGLSYDSRAVKEGFLFAAIPGEHVDGHAFIKNAVAAGASAVLAEKETQGAKASQIIVNDIRAALSHISHVFHGKPSERLTVIGITGTNGKTTTTFLLEAILRAAGFNTGVIGTVNYRYNGNTYPAPHTTPQAPDLHKILKDMAGAGVTHCVMEASSHALEQKRVADCAFKAAAFTNLTHDHLDYHKTMEEYFRCKALLFNAVGVGKGISVVNIDDSWGRKLKEAYPEALTFSLKAGADIYPLNARLADGVTEASIATPFGTVNVSSHLVGEYNLQNIMAAVGVAAALGIKADAISKGIEDLERVPGRLEKIESRGPKKFRAYVDYAHTGDALERALLALKRVATGRIITVFGCGGNRDRLKRPKMGEISARLSDVTIVTSDNPRDEDPLEIIKEIEAGIKGVKRHEPDTRMEGGYTVIPDRKSAIRKAVETAEDGDTILVAGKGHEDYQIVKGVKSHFSDFEELDSAIKELYGRKAV